MRMSRTMRRSISNTIEVDKTRIIEDIKDKGKYKENGIIIKNWENNYNDYAKSFLGVISKNKSSFIGILNNKFEREGYGINYLESGDQYLGYFENDQRNKEGIYLWSPETKDKKIITESYFGQWKNNKKEKNGIYLWLEEPKDNSKFDNAEFEAYVGEVENDAYKRGTFLSKIKDDFYLYHGNFDREGKKTDDNAYFYSSKYDRLLHGKVFRDNFLNGYVSFFDSSSGLLKDLTYCSFDNDGGLTSIVLKEDLQKEEKEREEKAICNFRNAILDMDYFGNLYANYKEIRFFIEENMDSTEAFDDQEKYNEILRLCALYKKDNIYNDIEKNIFKKKSGGK